jgi:hypothetical protein
VEGCEGEFGIPRPPKRAIAPAAGPGRPAAAERQPRL